MATIIGIILSCMVFFSAIYLGTGGNYKVFLDFHATLLVLGGTLAATFICFPFTDVLKVFRSILLVFAKEKTRFHDYIVEIASLAKEVREIKSYETINLTKVKDTFLRDGLQMLKDGIHSSDDIREILETRVANMQNRENAEAYILVVMGKLAPAFGMVGTLIGMIDMLRNMSSGDLSKIGQGMSVALTATFYGLILSNLILNPFAEKLKRRSEEDTIFKRMIIEGIVLLNEFQHPFVVEDRLNSYVPYKKREESMGLEGFKLSLGSEPATKENEEE